MDKYNSNKIKGLLALLIIIHHLSIYIKDTILLKVFTIVGVIAVSAFFFYSGYGLMTSYLKKENYLKDFWNKRIMKIVIPYIIAPTPICIKVPNTFTGNPFEHILITTNIAIDPINGLYVVPTTFLKLIISLKKYNCANVTANSAATDAIVVPKDL